MLDGRCLPNTPHYFHYLRKLYFYIKYRFDLIKKMKNVTFISVTPDTVPSVAKRDILKISTNNKSREQFINLTMRMVTVG